MTPPPAAGVAGWLTATGNIKAEPKLAAAESGSCPPKSASAAWSSVQLLAISTGTWPAATASRMRSTGRMASEEQLQPEAACWVANATSPANLSASLQCRESTGQGQR